MGSPQRRPYATPAAFRRAITDKLRAIASPRGPWPLADLQRQFAYDRLLVRLYLLDDGWVVKGATALLARGIAVRHTVDIDLYRAASRQEAERDLRSALVLDAGDWLDFEAGAGVPVADGASGVRVPVNARIGATSWVKFHVDVVAEGIRMTGRPDDVPPLLSGAVTGLVGVNYRAYPLVDHIADKTCAILERQGPGQYPSTRFKDLVDLVVLTGHARPVAEEQRRALVSEASRRDLRLPDRFEVPDPTLWARGYAAEARRATAPVAPTLSAALDRVRPFLDPLLDGTATGTWDPERRAWNRPAAGVRG
jgi:hypothetical protein